MENKEKEKLITKFEKIRKENPGISPYSLKVKIRHILTPLGVGLKLLEKYVNQLDKLEAWDNGKS